MQKGLLISTLYLREPLLKQIHSNYFIKYIISSLRVMLETLPILPQNHYKLTWHLMWRIPHQQLKHLINNSALKLKTNKIIKIKTHSPIDELHDHNSPSATTHHPHPRCPTIWIPFFQAYPHHRYQPTQVFFFFFHWKNKIPRSIRLENKTIKIHSQLT